MVMSIENKECAVYNMLHLAQESVYSDVHRKL